MTSKLFKPLPSDVKSLESGKEKLRKYRFTADHVPYLTKYPSGDTIMTDVTPANPALVPLAKVAKKVSKPAAPKKVAAKKPALTSPLRQATQKAIDKKAKKAAPTSTDGKVSLKAICQKLALDPKAARVKLRRNRDKLGFHNTTDRWMFTAIQAEKVTEVLKG